MTADLIQRLRACSAAERRTVALELAQTGTDEAITELIRMADAEIRDYAPRTWRTLWIRSLIRYDLNDQLKSIEALGDTGSSRALNYLRHIAKDRTDTEVYGGLEDPDTGRPYRPDYAYEVYTYPNAKGELALRMRFSGPHYCCNLPDLCFSERFRREYPEENIKPKKMELPDDEIRKRKEKNIYHKTLNTAIQKLVEAFRQNAPPNQ